MDPKTDKLVRRTAMLGCVTAAYFLLAADYGSPPNLLDPTEETGKEIPNSNGVKKESWTDTSWVAQTLDGEEEKMPKGKC